MSETPRKQILRWLGVLPGAVLAGFVVLFPVHWASMMYHYFGDSGSDILPTTVDGKGLLQAMPIESLERFMDALIVPGTVILSGACIAPRFHFATGITVTLFLIGAMSFLILRVYSNGFQIVDSPVRVVVTSILWLASVIFALFQTRQMDKPA